MSRILPITWPGVGAATHESWWDELEPAYRDLAADFG